MSSLQICLTHDIDRIRKTYQYLTRDLKKRNFRNLKSLYNGEQPYWQFETMAELEEKYGAKSTIFFLHESAKTKWLKPNHWQISLGRYSVKEPEVKRIIRWFDENGWEIGVHGSYYSWNNPELLRQEKQILEEVLGNEVQGIRQHYLNMEEPLTWNLQWQAGFKYDASLGRTDGIGYKDNRIRPFLHDETGITVIPLTLMECYLFREAGNDPQKALKLAISWMNHAQENEVPYTILWHQRMFNENEFPGYKWVYEEILKEAVGRQAEFVTCRELMEYASVTPSPNG